MNILYVYAHPNPASFNGVLKKEALKLLSSLNHNVIVSDLYSDKFTATASWNDFLLNKEDLNSQYFLAQQEAYNRQKLSTDITKEIEKITTANHIIFEFPLWWFSMPAILKGWFDRVLVKGFAYDAGKVFKDGLLKGKTASIVTTTQSPESTYQPNGAHGATLDTFLHPIYHTLEFVGIKPTPPFAVYNAFNLDEKQEKEIIGNFKTYLKSL